MTVFYNDLIIFIAYTTYILVQLLFFWQVPQTTSDEHKEKKNRKTKKSFITVNQLKMSNHTRSTSNKKTIVLDDA